MRYKRGDFIFIRAATGAQPAPTTPCPHQGCSSAKNARATPPGSAACGAVAAAASCSMLPPTPGARHGARAHLSFDSCVKPWHNTGTTVWSRYARTGSEWRFSFACPAIAVASAALPCARGFPRHSRERGRGALSATTHVLSQLHNRRSRVSRLCCAQSGPVSARDGTQKGGGTYPTS